MVYLSPVFNLQASHSGGGGGGVNAFTLLDGGGVPLVLVTSSRFTLVATTRTSPLMVFFLDLGRG